MEKKLFVCDSNNELIKKFSQALINHGITEGADCYYVDDSLTLPFFKIPKAYLREKEGDPDFHYAFVDIDSSGPYTGKEEYTVTATYHHEHLSNADDAALLVKKLLTGEICEVALVTKNAIVCTFMENTGDHQKNVSSFMDHHQIILDTIKAGRENMHLHKSFEPSAPYCLYCSLGEQQMFTGYNAYIVSSVLAVHPEFYIIN